MQSNACRCAGMSTAMKITVPAIVRRRYFVCPSMNPQDRSSLLPYGLSVRSNHTRSSQRQWTLGTCTAAVALDLGQDLGLRQVWVYVTLTV